MAFKSPTDPPIPRPQYGVKRERSLGTRVTEVEYQRVLRAAGGRAPSEWVREVVLKSIEPTPDRVLMTVLEELDVVRRLLLNGPGREMYDPITAVLDAEKRANVLARLNGETP